MEEKGDGSRMYSLFERMHLTHMSGHVSAPTRSAISLRSFILLVFCAVFLVSTLPVTTLASHSAGEVLYHQDFTRVSTAHLAGIRAGSANAQESQIGVTTDGLVIDPNGERRTYAILPEIENTDTYTVDLTFRFRSVHRTNGYFAFLLTCTGDKPSNVTPVVLRADGAVDGFGDLDNAIVQHYKNGDPIRLTIPVVDGVLHSLTISSGTDSQTLERTSLLRIPDGNCGFCVRNASVLIEDTAILYGTDYEMPTGYYATHSYAEDDGARTDILSPATGDTAVYLLPAALGCAIFLCACCMRLRRHIF